MADFYAAQGVTTIIVVGEDNQAGPATVSFAKTYAQQNQFGDPEVVVADPSFTKINDAAQFFIVDGSAIPHYIVLDHKMEIWHTAPGIVEANDALTEITGVHYPGFDQ